MPYAATAIKVMIASPSDVVGERNLIRDVIAEWNAIYSQNLALVLMPVASETHSTPDASGTAQETINKHLLADCDLLIATFWTRIGSPTNKSISGTVEEIREHIQTGKQAMIYFSSAPVRPDAIDDEQYAALKAFKADCKQIYGIAEYENLSDYRQKLTHQLGLTMIRHFYPLRR